MQQGMIPEAAALKGEKNGLASRLLGWTERTWGIRRLRKILWRLCYSSASRESTFTKIVRDNAWEGAESVSGPGSDRDQTQVLVRELPGIFRSLQIESLLDVPCGDFHWMKNVDMGASLQYTGADIVPDLVVANQAHTSPSRTFIYADLLSGGLPRADLVFCRDCLVHFSIADIFKALQSICDSGAEYLLTSHFGARTRNGDIVTGEWRPINLTKPPFNLPDPLQVVVEGCTEQGGAYKDKALALWRVADIKRSIMRTA
jgi:hypothetical protein